MHGRATESAQKHAANTFKVCLESGHKEIPFSESLMASSTKGFM